MKQGIFGRYWRAYGGYKALLKSPYLWGSICLTAILFPLWTKPGWWEDVLSIMPNVLGFSLGGYAMWIAIGDESFRELISGEDESGEASPYMEMNAAFVHFILLQLLAIFLALVAKAYSFPMPSDWLIYQYIGEQMIYISLVGYFVAFLVFIYALASALAATFALLRVSSWYDMSKSNPSDTPEKGNSCETN